MKIASIRAVRGHKSAPYQAMMKTILSTAFLAAALIVPVTLAPTQLRAEDHKYHDKGHNDDHQWNAHEDKAYRMWAKENHRKYVNFEKLKAEDQESYWAWRHEHSDALLKIDIH